MINTGTSQSNITSVDDTNTHGSVTLTLYDTNIGASVSKITSFNDKH